MSTTLHIGNVADGSHLAFIGYDEEFSAAIDIPRQKPAAAKEQEGENPTSQHVPWGLGDDMPRLLDDMMNSSPDLRQALELKAQLLYTGGVKYRIKKADGTIDETPNFEIDRFIRRSRNYALFGASQLYKRYWTAAQFMPTPGFEKIWRIHPLEVDHCRFHPINADGFLEKIYLNAKFIEGAAITEKETKSFLCIDPRYYDEETLKLRWPEIRGKHESFVMPCSIYTGHTYYPEITWYITLKKSKWIDLALQYPLFKTSLMKNQMHINYHFEMPADWMARKFKDFDTYSLDKKKKLIKEEIGHFKKAFKGSDKAGGQVVSTYLYNPQTGKEYGGWKITRYDNGIKEGMYVQDSLEVSGKIWTAVGVDSSIKGLTQGDPSGSRSGSDRREAMNIHLCLTQMDEDVFLRPYDYAATWNGWNNDEQLVEFYTAKPQLQTLDQVTPSQRETTPAA